MDNSQQPQNKLPTSCTKTVPYKHQTPTYNQPNGQDKKAQKTKATYSAQYEAPGISRQQKLNSSNSSPPNIPNMAAAGYPCCNGIPLYNVSSRMMNNEQNISMDNAGARNNMLYSCPCSNLPPPMPPCKDDLWDLQFCRWWGWNWIRKREEMMNQQKTEVNAKRATSPELRKFKNKPRRGRKQDDFFSWCNKLFKGRRKQNRILKDEDRQQLQELYATPCSSITFNKCPCPMDDWECRSLDLKGQYECYCGSARQTSTSTVIVQNKTRHQRCKQNMRKHQSWVYEKTDSSSSDELCMCVCPRRNASSTEESVEYLSMRMAQVKSDDEGNQECCTCTKQKETKKDVCCPCKMLKNQEINVCCPCMIKLVYKKPSDCNSNKYLKQKYCPNIAEEKLTKCHCYRSPSPCRGLSVRRTSPPRKVPQFRRLPRQGRCPEPLRNSPECRKGPKRKYIECCCQKNKGYMVCPCEQPKKKIRISRKPKEVCCYYCCCSDCCCSCNKKDASAENTKASKSEKILKQTVDKVSSKGVVENPNVTSCKNNNNSYQPQCYGMYNQVNDANFCRSFPIGDCIQDNVYNTGQFSVSKALQEGLYASPLTGRLYSLNPKTFTVNQALPQMNLPGPLKVSENVFNFSSAEPPTADEEHKALLAAVCAAIMSSRHSQTSISQKPQFPPNNHRRSRGNQPRPTRYKHSTNREQHFTRRSFDNSFGSDKTQNSTPATELEELGCTNFTISHAGVPMVSNPFDYKLLLSPSNVKIPLPSFGVSENFKHNVKTLLKQKSVSDMTGKNKYYITNGKHGLIRQRCPRSSVEHRNYTTQQLYNLNLIESEQRMVQISTNVPRFEEKYSMKSLNTDNSLNSMEGFSTTNIYETCNKETSYDPSFQNYYAERLIVPPNLPKKQKSSTDNSSGGSGDSINSQDTFVPTKKNLAKEQTESYIPFNSPRNWIIPPKLPGISMTGLFSTVGDIKGITKSSRYITKKRNNKSSYNNTEQLKKQRLYDSLFSNDHPDYSENFSNIPYNFGPIPNSRSTARNPTIYPTLVLRELPADVAHATQTSTAKTCIGVSTSRSQKDLGCSCKNNECKNVPKQEMDCTILIKEHESQCKSAQPACSAANVPTNTVFSKEFQPASSRTSSTYYVLHPAPPQANITKGIESNSRLARIGASKTAKACNTIYTMPPVGNFKLTEPSEVINSKTQTSNSKMTQTSSIPFTPLEMDSSKATTTCDPACSKFQLANNSKPTETSGVVGSKLLPPEGNSKTIAIETTNVNSKLSAITASKSTETSNHGQMKQEPSSILFTTKYNSEKEIGCRYYNEVSPKELHKTSAGGPFKDVNSLQNRSEKEVQQKSEEICILLQHQPEDFILFPNATIKFKQSEHLLTVVDGVFEESRSNVPLAPSNLALHDMPTTSKCEDCCRSSNIEEPKSLPKSFTTATPVYLNTSTSPLKFKYAKTRLRDRSLPDNFVQEKIPKRESPFSMFCTPVTTKTIDITPSANNEINDTDSLSRPHRQMVLAKPKKLQVREKRWRY